MAHIDQYKATQVVGILGHNERTGDTPTHNHSNEDIDTARTKDNYELHSTEGTAYERYKARMEQVHCMKRDDINVLESLVVTMPKDVKDGDERKFFEAVYAFACEDYGKENIINATVHKDESRPHIHVGFIPVVNDKLRNGKPCEKVCHKKLITQTYLDQFHTRLSDFIAEQLGYEVEIQNGATAGGNKTVQELKADRAKQKADQLQQRVDELESKVEELTQTVDDKNKLIEEYEHALTEATADVKETKTVKGVFGKEKEVPKTADELERDKTIVGAKLVLQREGAVQKREQSVETDRQLLAATVNNAVARQRQEDDERLRVAVARARKEEQVNATQSQAKLQKERDNAVKAQKTLKQQYDTLAETALDLAYLFDDLTENGNIPEGYKTYATDLSERVKAQTSPTLDNTTKEQNFQTR